MVGRPVRAGERKRPAARPAQAYYSKELSEFLLPYDEVRRAPSPRAALLDFMQSTYDAGATLAKWNRAELDRP